MKLGVTLDILNQKATPAFYADTLANRPAAGYTGRVFISTDTLDLYRDTGTTWVLLSPSSTGTITGSGSAGQVTFFSGTSSITGTNNLFWDTTNLRLGINTNTAGASLDVHSATGIVAQLNVTTATNNTELAFQNAGTGKWRIGNSYNAGTNDFQVYDVVNSLQRFSVKNTGQTFVGTQTTSSGLFVVNSATGDNHIVAIGATAPSIRVRNAGTAPTQQFGLGLSTATNNFIQGSASGDFCIFNSSTTASPILLGIYNSGTGNVEEGARLSASKNFLIGTTTDAGQKLQVNGTALVSSNFTAKGDLLIWGGNAAQAGQITANSAGGGLYIAASGTNQSIRIVPSGTGIVQSVGAFDVQGAATFSSKVSAGSSTETLNAFSGVNNSLAQATIYSYNYNSAGYSIYSAQGINYFNGNTLIGTTTDAGYKLNVNGSVYFNSTSYTNGIATFGSSVGSGLRIYGGSGTHQWDVYLNSTNLRISDNTSGGSVVIDTPIQIANVVTAAVGIASTHKVSILINGVQYYLLASNV